jgi:hypothetical protein
MTCKEFERVLPQLEGGHTMEQEAHLTSCAACSELVADLKAISQQARLLQESDEPSPRVWNSIEMTLLQEGLIHQPQGARSPLPAVSTRPRLGWLVPLTAAILVAFGVLLHERGGRPAQYAEEQPVFHSPAAALANDDAQLLTLVAQRTPAMRAAIEADLRSVDAYVQDAEQSARSNPNDEVAQEYLMSAYEQRSMVYEMALDRSLQ